MIRDFKEKFDKENTVYYEEVLLVHKEQFEDHLSKWKYKISKWKERRSVENAINKIRARN